MGLGRPHHRFGFERFGFAMSERPPPLAFNLIFTKSR